MLASVETARGPWPHGTTAFRDSGFILQRDCHIGQVGEGQAVKRDIATAARDVEDTAKPAAVDGDVRHIVVIQIAVDDQILGNGKLTARKHDGAAVKSTGKGDRIAAEASAMVCLSDPAPSSLVFVTVRVVMIRAPVGPGGVCA